MASGSRKPRVRLLIDGQAVPCVQASVQVSRHPRADTFTAVAPLASSGRSLEYWSNVGPVECIVQACNDVDEGWVELLSGQLDRCVVRGEFAGGVRVELSGRDKTAKLLDARRTRKDSNKKASDIVKDLAQQHGLDADVDESDSDAGKIHTDETAHLIDNDTDWNVISRLAEREGVFHFLKGNTLYFKKPGNDDVGFGKFPIRFTPPSRGRKARGNVMDITLVQNVHLNRGVKQTVRSFHTRKEKNICTTKEAQAAGYGQPLEWIDHIPGLTDAQVEQVATKKQLEKQRHEMGLQVTMPGDVTIDPRMMLEVSGTGSSWDQDYHIDTINHSFGPLEGYLMTIAGKNAKGGEGGGQDSGAGGGTPTGAAAGASGTVQGPPAPISGAPLPPSRPAGL